MNAEPLGPTEWISAVLITFGVFITIVALIRAASKDYDRPDDER